MYGTTQIGGANHSGTIFTTIPSSNALSTLYSFCSESNCADGSQPYAALLQASNGNLYGTTRFGGAYNDGTVFEVTLDGTLTTLYSFSSLSNCTILEGLFSCPRAGLIQASDGNLYGTTESGGAYGDGMIFKIRSQGGALTTLYSFCSASGCADGENPFAGLLQATNGNLYGTTFGGGADGGGTVFEITLDGKFQTLHSFCSASGCADGENPLVGLVQTTNGNLYGTTYGGGTNGDGTVFEITP